MEIPKYIVFRVDVMRKGTSVELTNITDEVEDVIFKTDRKTENSSEIPNNSTCSKMEQVDKDINVRSKTEPQTEMTTEQIVNELLSIKQILADGKMPTDCAWVRTHDQHCSMDIGHHPGAVGHAS